MQTVPTSAIDAVPIASFECDESLLDDGGDTDTA
jgi:hypothetical protein